MINLVSFYENTENQCKIAYLRGSSKGYFLLFEAEVFEISRQIRNPVVKVYWESHDDFQVLRKFPSVLLQAMLFLWSILSTTLRNSDLNIPRFETVCYGKHL